MLKLLYHDQQEECDPELSVIAAHLRETASYAISPTFREKLRRYLLRQLRESRRGELRMCHHARNQAVPDHPG
jgi:hypothetical protein